MTLVEAGQEHVASRLDVEAEETRPRFWHVCRWLAGRPETPWTAFAGVAVWLLALAGNPALDAVIYGLYWFGAVVIPGVLLQRALLGSRSLPEDIGFGSVLGLAWQLIGWFVFTALQLQSVLWMWPIALVALFAVLPGLRRNWRVAHRVPLAWSWASSGSMAVAMVMLYVSWLRDTELPPFTRLLEPDLWYHLAINGELTRTVFPDLPYIAGEPLQYHWFANAHMASGHMMTGVDPAAIVLHLWLVPIVLTLFLVTCGLSRSLTGLWWPGVLAGTLTVALPPAIAVSTSNIGLGLTPIVFASSSSILAGVVMVALARVVLSLIKMRSSWRGWCALALIALLAAGTKPTLLPLALAGTVVAASYLLARGRPVRRVGLVLGLLGGAFVLGGFAVIGGTAGSQVRLFGYFRFVEGFRQVTGDQSVQGVTGGWVVPGVVDSGLAGWMLAAAMLAALVLYHVPSLLGVVGVLLRTTRDDVAVWWLAGANMAAYGPLLMIDHMGGSQKYFVVTVFPLGIVLTLHVVARTLPARRGTRFRWSMVLVAILGAVAASASVRVLGGDWTSIRSAVLSLGAPAALFALMTTGVVTLSRRAACSSSGHGVTLVAALAMGWSVPHTLAVTVGEAVDTTQANEVAAVAPRLPAAKQRAAVWLGDHAAADDVVVTNAHCFKFTDSGRCDARGFWISALSGQRVLLEGWGYTAANALTRVHPKLTYELQPSPWPQRLQQSDQAVTAPSAELLSRLARYHGARWVFADRTVDAPSPRLNDLAMLRFANQDVMIFELRQREGPR